MVRWNTGNVFDQIFEQRQGLLTLSPKSRQVIEVAKIITWYQVAPWVEAVRYQWTQTVYRTGLLSSKTPAIETVTRKKLFNQRNELMVMVYYGDAQGRATAAPAYPQSLYPWVGLRSSPTFCNDMDISKHLIAIIICLRRHHQWRVKLGMLPVRVEAEA